MNIIIVLIIVAVILLVVPKLIRSASGLPPADEVTPAGGVEKQCVNCPGCSACIGVKSNKIIPKIRRSVSVVEHFENKDNRPTATASRATSYARGRGSRSAVEDGRI